MLKEGKESCLKQLLFDLARDVLQNEELQESINALIEIYKDGYRHSYSSLFSSVKEINDNHNTYSTEFLLENLQNLKNIASSQNFEDEKVEKSIYKFYDHIMLELLRLQHYGQIEDNARALKAQLEADKKTIEELKAELKQSKEYLDTANEKAKNIQAETIGIIGIFAAVTLAFSGGLSYLSSAISSVYNSPTLKLILVILICGFVLFNTIFVLLYVVARIIDKNIFFKCNPKKCKDCPHSESNNKCTFIGKIRKCLPYLFWVNILLLILIALVIGGIIYTKSPCCPDWLKQF